MWRAQICSGRAKLQVSGFEFKKRVQLWNVVPRNVFGKQLTIASCEFPKSPRRVDQRHQVCAGSEAKSKTFDQPAFGMMAS